MYVYYSYRNKKESSSSLQLYGWARDCREPVKTGLRGTTKQNEWGKTKGIITVYVVALMLFIFVNIKYFIEKGQDIN